MVAAMAVMVMIMKSLMKKEQKRTGEGLKNFAQELTCNYISIARYFNR